LSRFWLNATSGSDKFINASALAELMRPQSKPIRDYRSIHPFPLSYFDRIIRGAVSPDRFVATSASRFDGLYGIEAYLEVLLVESVWHMASQAVDSAPHAEVLLETRKSSLLWTNLFSLLLRSVEDDRPDFTNALNGSMVLPPTIFLAGAVIANCSKTQNDFLPALAKLWARTEMIHALSQCIIKGVLNNQEHDGWLTRE
jgi:hypothetical protein